MKGLIIQPKKIDKSEMSYYGAFDKIIYIKVDQKENSIKKINNKETIRCFIGSYQENREEINTLIKGLEPSTYWYFFGFGEKSVKNYIYALNKFNSTNIDYKKFRDKSQMQSFLGESITKKNILKINLNKVNQEEVDYFFLHNKKSIIKPINGTSSVETYVLHSQNDFNQIKERLQQKEYVLESFIEGEQFAVNFYVEEACIYIFSITKCITNQELSTPEKTGLDSLEIPIRYSIPIEQLTYQEITFLSKIREKLSSIQFRGFMHVEYKRSIDGKVGFIERGARNGYYRNKIYTLVTGKHISNIFLTKEGFEKTPIQNTYIFNEEDNNYIGYTYKKDRVDKEKMEMLKNIKGYEDKISTNKYRVNIIQKEKNNNDTIIMNYMMPIKDDTYM